MMKTWLKILIFITALFITVLNPFCNSFAETLKVIILSKANPPFTITHNGKHSGIYIDIFNRLSAMTKHTFIMLPYPPARAIKEFNLGRVDIEPGVNEEWRATSKITAQYSISFAKSTDFLVFKKVNRFLFSSSADLTGKTIGVIRGYAYPEYESAFANGTTKRFDALSEKQLLKLLMANRIKQIIIGSETFFYHQKLHPQYQQFEIGGIISQVEVKMRIHPSKSHLLPEINAALSTMLQNGEIKEIYDKYH